MSAITRLVLPREEDDRSPTRFNPPGRAALAYAGGRYLDTLRRMLAALPAERGPRESQPLAALNRDVHDDWSIALVHAWAVATEVLGFYQERIVNEGYLRTAAEYRSVLELARAIGYEPRPGVAATAYLAFSVLTTKEEPARQVFMPGGCAVLSVPAQGRLPQTFETDEPFTARAEWNLIRPELAAGTIAARVGGASPGLRLAGLGLAIQPGDLLLLVGGQPGDSAALPPWLLAEVTAVTPDQRRLQTALSWRILPRAGAPAELREARVFALRPPAGLFTYSSGGVYLRDAGGAWGPASLGMPGLNVRALARAGTGALVAATDRGVYRSLDGGAAWRQAGAGFGPRPFHALAADAGGLLYAGGEGGMVAVSADGGATWTTVSGELPRQAGKRAGPLPRTVVRALAAERAGGRERLVAGTDDGIFQSGDRGRTWEPANDGLPSVDPKTGLAAVPIRDLAPLPAPPAPDTGLLGIGKPAEIGWGLGICLAGALLAALLFGPLGIYPQLFNGLGGVYSLLAQAVNPLLEAFRGLLIVMVRQPIGVLALPEFTPLPDPITSLARWIEGVTGRELWWRETFTLGQLAFVADVLALGLGLFLAAAMLARGKNKKPPEPKVMAASDAGVFKAPEKKETRDRLTMPLVGGLAGAVLLGPIDLLALLIALANRIIGLVFDALALVPGLAEQGLQAPALPTNILEEIPGQLAKLGPVGPWLAGALAQPQLTFAANALLVAGLLALGAGLLGRARKALAARPAASLGKAVASLTAGPGGRLYAATAEGLARSNDGAAARAKGLARVRANLAGMALGEGARAWETIRLSPGSPAVSALVVGPRGELLAGLVGGRVLRSADGETWELLGDTALRETLALLPLPAGELVAGGAPPEDPAETLWSPWHLGGGLLDLAGVDPELRAGDLVLVQPGAAGRPEPRRAREVAVVESGDPARPARLTRVSLEPAGGLVSFERGGLTVRGLTAPFALADERPVADDVLVCGFVPGLEVGQAIVVSGRRVRALAPRSGADGGAPRIASLDGLREDALVPGEPLVVLAAPWPRPAPGAPEIWRVRTREGRVGLLACAAGALALAPADDDDEVVSELAEVRGVLHTATRTTLTLARRLANAFDRGTVAICANVVRASHGASVSGELLGTSEAMSVNQRFLLNQPPLTYVATPEGVKSTLKVTVNGVRWDEVAALHANARNHRAFMARRDAAAGAPAIPPATDEGGPLAPEPPRYPPSELIFGDGVDGAGLPTGTWRIEASYRSGIGSLGNVPAASLTVLQRAPRGLKSVSNPLPAGGGVDPETTDEARARAPLGLRAMERVVTASDIEDFARAYPGVSKVRADTLRVGRHRLLHLTIADSDAPDGAVSGLADALAGAIAARRATPLPPLYVGRCALARFSVKARLLLEPAHAGRAARIVAEARAALVAAFSFAARELGQPVAPSELTSLLQAREGVAAVELLALYHNGDTGAGVPRAPLAAAPARAEGGALLPAELLLIDATSDSGIVLEVA